MNNLIQNKKTKCNTNNQDINFSNNIITKY